jgi:hypothetical protein
MSGTDAPNGESHDPLSAAEPSHAPRADLKDALGWIALGFAVVIGSLAMDRLEGQNINPYTVPGLLQGLLGIAMVLLGGLLALRSWRRGAFHMPLPPATPHEREQRRRIWVVTTLCVAYGAVLVGHGIAFWLASTIFVTGSILIMQRMSNDEAERALTAKSWAKAVAVGLGSAVITQLVFQELFLVRLP